jgi:hypothetical protein
VSLRQAPPVERRTAGSLLRSLNGLRQGVVLARKITAASGLRTGGLTIH